MKSRIGSVQPFPHWRLFKSACPRCEESCKAEVIYEFVSFVHFKMQLLLEGMAVFGPSGILYHAEEKWNVCLGGGLQLIRDSALA